MERTWVGIALWVGIIASFVLAALLYWTVTERMPAFAELAPIEGTVARAGIVENDDHGDNFTFWLDDGQRFFYLEGEPKYQAITRAVSPGTHIRLWPRRMAGYSSLAQLEVEGMAILRYEEARGGNDERIRNSVIGGTALTLVGLCVASALAVQLRRASRSPTT